MALVSLLLLPVVSSLLLSLSPSLFLLYNISETLTLIPLRSQGSLHYRTLEEARSNIEHFLMQVYRTQRLHSALSYRPPKEFERLYAQGLLS